MNGKIILVIPAFNEEKTIGKIMKRAKPFCDEILLVSAKKTSDRTRKIAKKLGANILIDGGKGKGEAMRLAIENIDGGIIVFIDADGSHIPEDIPRIVEPIRKGEADMVIGSRLLGGSMELHGTFDKFLRMFFSMCIAQLINWRFGVSISDTQNGFRAIPAKVAKKLELKANKFDIETEMCMKCFKRGYRVVEVPSMELKREFGKSGISIAKLGWIYAYRFLINL